MHCSYFHPFGFVRAGSLYWWCPCYVKYTHTSSFLSWGNFALSKVLKMQITHNYLHTHRDKQQMYLLMRCGIHQCNGNAESLSGCFSMRLRHKHVCICEYSGIMCTVESIQKDTPSTAPEVPEVAAWAKHFSWIFLPKTLIYLLSSGLAVPQQTT